MASLDHNELNLANLANINDRWCTKKSSVTVDENINGIKIIF